MDFSRAYTQHLTKYRRFHVDLNTHVKISTAAIDNLGNIDSDPSVLSDKISQLIVNAGERWTKTHFKDPIGDIKRVRREMTESAIMRVYSAFEIYCDELNGSYDEYLKTECESTKGDTPTNRVKKIYKKFGWKTETISYLFPMLEFYDTLRHCVVHQLGMANSELVGIANSESFLLAVKNWPTVTPNRTISPPPIVRSDGVFELKPHHSITYSDVCYRIVIDADKNLMTTLGAEYFVRKIGKGMILDAEGLPNPSIKDAYHFIRHSLGEKFGIVGATIPEIRRCLGGDPDCKTYYRRYRTLLDGVTNFDP